METGVIRDVVGLVLILWRHENQLIFYRYKTQADNFFLAQRVVVAGDLNQ